MLQGYVDSGYYGTFAKIKDSFRHNARYQLIILLVGSCGLLYIILSSGLTFSSIKALAIALSHSYALVIALWLMGHGFINIPRRSWVEANQQVRLKHFYQQATQTNDAIAEAQSDYADIAAEIYALGPFKDTRYTDWIQKLLDQVEEGPGIPISSTTSAVTGRSRVQIERSMINEEYLSTLSRRFITARNRLVRYDADWQKLLREASRSEDIIKSQENKSLVFRYKKTPLPPKAAFAYYYLIKPQLERIIAILCAILTIILVWSEITHGTILSIVNIAISRTTGFWQQALSSIFLGYMCVCSLASLSRIRIFKVYALVYRHSDPSSMLWYAMYACRLTVPLSFNFITLITSRESVFEEFLGKFINLTPLGKYFNDWLPRFILIPMLITSFHLYDRIRDFFGFGLSFDSEDDIDDEGMRGSAVEGKHLIRRSLTDPSYRYAIRHPNISSVSGNSIYQNSENNSNSSLLGSGTNSRGSLDRGERTARPPGRTVKPSNLHRHIQLGGGNVNRTRIDEQSYIDDEAQRRGSGAEYNNDDYEQENGNANNIIAELDTKVKGFLFNIGNKFKSLSAKKSGIDNSSANAPIIPRYQDEDEDDDDLTVL